MFHQLLRSIIPSGGRIVGIILLVLFFFSGFLNAQVPERTYYITDDGDDDCSDNHCGLQAALDSALFDSAHITFLLAEGIYTGAYDFSPDSGECYGDLIFEGGWDVSFEKRNDGHETVFDGEEQHRALNIRKDLSERAGAIVLDGIKIQNCSFSGSGGGLSVQTYGSDIIVNNCVILDNVAMSADGSFGVVGGGIVTISHNPETKSGAKILYSNNYIARNKAGVNATYGQGGGIFTYAIDSLVLVNNIIVNNEALGSNGIGGGIELYSRGAEVLFSNNVFSGNFAQISGGGTANHITAPYKASNFEYVNNIIYGNTKGSGYGIDAYSGVRVIDGHSVSINYHHNIIGQHSSYPGTVSPVYSNNLTLNPKFIDTLYHVAPSSPAVNAGDNSAKMISDLDYFGNERIQFDRIDMGVHEHDGLVAYYKLDGEAKDYGLNGIDGFFHAALGIGVMNDVEGALHVVADTQRVLVPHHAELNMPSKLSFSMWFNADSLNTPAHLLSKAYSCNHNGNLHVYLGRGGGISQDYDRPTFSYYDGTGLNKSFICDDTVRVNEWNFFAVVTDFATHDIELYLNGVEVSGFWYDGVVPVGSTATLTPYSMGIGASITSEDGCLGYLAGEGQYPFYGRIDEVKIYNQVLEAEELAEIYSMPPYDVQLSRSEMNENLSIGESVAVLSALDPNVGDTHTYELVSGTGGPDNAYFSIQGDLLKVASLVSYEEEDICDILVRVNDEAGHSKMAQLRVLVNDMNDLPKVAIPIEDQKLKAGTAWSYIFPEGTFIDEDSWDHLSYSAKLSDESDIPSWMSFVEGDRAFSGTAMDADFLTVILSAVDDSSGVVTDEFDVQIDPNSVEIDGSGIIKMYPHPVVDYLFVELPVGMYNEIRIYSITGEEVMVKELEADGVSVLEMSHLSKGIYFYRIEGERKLAGKIVKM